MAYKWINTKYEGIRYREHASRSYGVRKDRYYVIRYRCNGDRKEEAIGWESQNDARDKDGGRISLLEVARSALAKLKESHRTGEGPATLAEKRTEAEQKLRMLESQAMTLRDYFRNDYLPSAKQRKKPESWGREVSLFDNWIDPLLGHIRIQEIGISQWDFLLTAMIDGGLSPRTRQYACLTLRLVLEHAFARKLVSDMPPRAKLIGATLKPESNRRTRIVTSQELQAILEALAKRDMYAYRLTLFCALSCCRFSEAANLQWKDVDLAIGRALFRNTKNGSTREIPLSDTLIDLLQSMGSGTGHVFLGSHGKPLVQAPASFRDVVEELGLNDGHEKLDRLVFHSLRHSGATRLGQSGVPLRDMMDLAGWKTPAMALRYQHSGDAGRRRAMAALESMTRVEPTNVVDLFGDS